MPYRDTTMQRNRLHYLLLIFLTVALGLASRHYSTLLPVWINDYAGDALWALMVFWGFGFIFTQKRTLHIAALSLLFSYGIEISQLYHAPWIDAVRANRLGGLVLGFGFLWSDIVSYTIGIIVGIICEMRFISKKINTK